MNKYAIVTFFFLLNNFLLFEINASEPDKSVCSDKWAISIEKAGLPNFHKVTDDLYRGAQPEKAGFQELKKMGIKTIVNLRSFHSDRDKIGNTGLVYEHIYMKSWHPEEKELVRFLKIVTDKKRTPVFVHCMHGADRTGLICATYRIAVCGWTKENAIREMKKGGFGFHKFWAGNIVKYINKIDFDSIRKKAGIVKKGDQKENKYNGK
ncbi:MAG: dual specificity protein phosphatase family protein [Desulfobacteraceae bacterium]|nr:dual specificity protein phosphatase family protein [Desulfobacteraceae bacterium]